MRRMAGIIMVTGMAMRISDTAKSAILLMAMTTVFPELLSGNTPLPLFLNPQVWIFFALAYALPVLLLRELAVRDGTGFAGLFIYGLAYGLLNEGVLAKTIFRETNVPIDTFSHYGFLGIGWPWTVLICAWHALASVVFPVAIVHTIFANASHRPWLGGRVALLLSLVLVVFACLFFINDGASQHFGTPPELIALITAMAVLLVIGSRLKGTIAALRTTSLLRPLVVGLSLLVPFLVLIIVPGMKLPVIVFFVTFAALLAGYLRYFSRHRLAALPAMAFVGFAYYVQTAAVSLIALKQMALFQGPVDALVLLVLWRYLKRADKPYPVAA